MSDVELRECEHALAESPDDLGLLQQHARLLRRHGQPERALASLDLAWRLGAEELRDELVAELERRSFEFLGLRFRYVPAGPFVMGLDDFDHDVAPAHRVRLSPYYVSETPVLWATLKTSPLLPEYWRQLLARDPDNDFGRRPFPVNDRSRAEVALAYLVDQTRAAKLPPGTLELPSEAQWERAFRASLLAADATSIYGVERSPTVEWVADAYRSDAYASSSEFDPRGPKPGKQFVIRGVPAMDDALFPLYRDAADENGNFHVGRGGRAVRHEEGISFRLVLNPA
ncbi:MAG: hypothetical protein KDD82_13250 [Planctomycetes bacterium]|nr:hypothetical protein [Planctomycetota bacterium]